MGMINEGEEPIEAAAREAEEETGWRPLGLRPLLHGQPAAGIMNLSHHVFVSEGAIEVGSPADNFESAKIAWVPIADVPKLIAEQQIVNYAAMASLLLVHANSVR